MKTLFNRIIRIILSVVLTVILKEPLLTLFDVHKCPDLPMPTLMYVQNHAFDTSRISPK